MATIKVKRGTYSASLPYGELAATTTDLYFGNSSNASIKLVPFGTNDSITAGTDGFKTGSFQLKYNTTTSSIDFIFS